MTDDSFENQLLNAFAGVDILKAEAVATVVGRVIASLHKGMTEGGLEHYDANLIIAEAIKVVVNASYAHVASQPQTGAPPQTP